MSENKRKLAGLMMRGYSCEMPFLDPPEYYGKNDDGVDVYGYFTEEGKQVYVQMVKFIFELEFLGVIDDSIAVMRKINQIIIDGKDREEE